MAAADVATRIAQLITLATDKGAGEHEARNAAVFACRLIRQHGLELVTKGELATLRARADVAERQARAAYAATERPPPSSSPWPRPRPRYDTRAPTRTIVNRYPNKHCMTCGQVIEVGARCEWVVEVGVRCLECADVNPRPPFDQR